MNVRLLSVLLTSIFLGMLFLSSCSDDEEEVYDPREHQGWGVFEGTLNGKKVFKKNEVSDWYLYCTFHRDAWDYNVLKGATIGIHLNSKEEIWMFLSGLNKGERLVTKSVDYDSTVNGIHFERTIPKETYSGTAYYVPSENNPFKIEITDLTHYDISSVPARICGRLDGVLYRASNPQQDSIVIKGYFEVR